MSVQIPNPDQAQIPNADQIVTQMRETLGEVPVAMEKSLGADPDLVIEHARSKQWAMPAEGGALDEQTRTLVYLAVALATSNHECTKAMVAKARSQGLSSAKLLEAFHIARFAQATAVLGNAEALFDLVNERAARGNGR